MTLILFLSLLTLPAFAPCEKAAYILRDEPVNPYERIWQAVCKVESSNRPDAINYKEAAYGICQLRKARLSDFNREAGQSYSLTDCLRPDISKIVFMHNATKFNPTDYRLIARDWNKSKTEIYWNKVKKAL